MSNIGPWLEQHGPGKYTDLLAESEIDVDVLDQLTLDELKDLGISLGARERLLKAAAVGIKSDPSDEPTQSTSTTPRTGEAERRQLTVTFHELVSSTALFESMNGADSRDLLGTYQSAAAQGADVLLVQFARPSERPDSDPKQLVARDSSAYRRRRTSKRCRSRAQLILSR